MTDNFTTDGPNVDLDADDPYADVDIDTLPEWWREAIIEFREHNLRSYRPPRFADGKYKYEVVRELEARFDVNIDFIEFDVETTDKWTVRVDRQPIGTVSYRRDTDGYSVYEMRSDAFKEMITSAIAERREDKG